MSKMVNGTAAPGRASIPERTLRTDNLRKAPLVTFVLLSAWVHRVGACAAVLCVGAVRAVAVGLALQDGPCGRGRRDRQGRAQQARREHRRRHRPVGAGEPDRMAGERRRCHYRARLDNPGTCDDGGWGSNRGPIPSRPGCAGPFGRGRIPRSGSTQIGRTSTDHPELITLESTAGRQ